jgi:hypothetical protein
VKTRRLVSRDVILCLLWFLPVNCTQTRWVAKWFSPGTPVFSTNKSDRHDITEILLKVGLNTIALPLSKSFDMDAFMSCFSMQIAHYEKILILYLCRFSHFSIQSNRTLFTKPFPPQFLCCMITQFCFNRIIWNF